MRIRACPPYNMSINQTQKPVLAIIGRPNVGKSTLFNRLTKTRDALVADEPGVTRDINIGIGQVGEAAYLVIDTGGIDSSATSEINEMVSAKALEVVDDADALVMVVDGVDGVTGEDKFIAVAARKAGKPLYLTVNKLDRISTTAAAEFNELGLGAPHLISALQGHGIESLIDEITRHWPLRSLEEEETNDAIKVAIIGRPNVGKSTLINRMLGEERMLTADFPGTTHDSIATNFERHGKSFTLIDTAGVRRRGKISERVEKFSVVKALQAIDLSHVVVVIVDGQEAVTEQDLHLLGLVVDSGRALLIAVNKWDGLETDQREYIKKELDRRLRFVSFARQYFVSALHGTGVGDLFAGIVEAHRAAQVDVNTAELTKLLEQAVSTHQPPLVRGRRIKLKHAHLGGNNPPKIIIHGNQVKSLPDAYKRYLTNYFRDALGLVGTTVRIQLRQGDNPFSGQRNKLTPRQILKKQRLKKYTGKKK